MDEFKNFRESDERLLAEMRGSKVDSSVSQSNGWRKMWTPYKQESSTRSSIASPSVAQLHKLKESMNNFKNRLQRDESPLTINDSFYDSPQHNNSRPGSRRNFQDKMRGFSPMASQKEAPNVRQSAQQLIAMVTSGEELPQPVGVTPELVIEIIRQVKGSLSLNEVIALINHLQHNGSSEQTCDTDSDSRRQELSESLKRSEEEIHSQNKQISELKQQVDMLKAVVGESHDLMKEMRIRWRKDRHLLRSQGHGSRPALSECCIQTDVENLPPPPLEASLNDTFGDDLKKHKEKAAEFEKENETLREVLNILIANNKGSIDL